MITATLNVRGSQPCMQQLFDLFALYTIVVTETWSDNQTVPANLAGATVPGITSKIRARLGGGISLLSLQPIHIIKRINTPKLQEIIVRHPSVRLLGVYIPPGQSASSIAETLNKLSPYIRGKTIIIGDFNARHVKWCTQTNKHGTYLRRWQKRHSLSLAARSSPTCRNSSTVDLCLGNGLEFKECITHSGSWDSHHVLVRSSVEINKSWRTPRIPRSSLND